MHLIIRYNNSYYLANGKVFSKGKKQETRGILGAPLDHRVFDQIMFKSGNDEFSNYSIYDISAGIDHVLALDDKYNIWGWGKNQFNQISNKEAEQLEIPTKISIVIKPIHFFSFNN